MYKANVQTTKRTKGSFAWQETSYLRRVKKARKQKLRQYKVEKPLIKQNKVKDICRAPAGALQISQGKNPQRIIERIKASI